MTEQNFKPRSGSTRFTPIGHIYNNLETIKKLVLDYEESLTNLETIKTLVLDCEERLGKLIVKHGRFSVKSTIPLQTKSLKGGKHRKTKKNNK